ncbi:PulJ/GspJ family protein [Candidatus Avelusimicrobium facis]|uniref:PulJ/GspJ family protein n=1 Tax=Candidatus Avelusimicrobium facis TaxID=3416203 RepID=UPI003D148A3F
MTNKKGFTLTEVLLAVMIVGLIAVALASLTRAAARESGVGRSKIMLRNNLSMFMRTLRGDMARATRVEVMHGNSAVGDNAVTLLQLAQNVDRDGNLILRTIRSNSFRVVQRAKWISYCFVRGSDNNNIQPADAYRGGKIYRLESTSAYPSCSGNLPANSVVLTNVKYIPPSSNVNYFVPLFALDSFSRSGTKSLLRVQIITELPSTPVVNDVVEEIFAMPNGY